MRYSASKTKSVLASAVAGVLLGACSTLPETVPQLEQARQAVTDIRQNPQVDRYARAELGKAESALSRAEAAYDDRADLAVIQHEAYMAEGYATIAEARIGEQSAREQLEDAELERSQVLEEVRAQEAREARLQADLATERADELERELEDLQAEETDRGLVLTLGDVLFDTAEAQLKPGANATIEQLAEFMNEYPDRRLLIEGHTDSRGDESYNQTLSRQRADAVRNALLSAGINSERLRTEGLGEAYPVASNETQAGRQQNRRVNIIISSPDKAGFPESMRDASPQRISQ